MKYLITGVAGFVGSSLARAILERNPDSCIVGVDDMSFGYKERIADIVDLIEFIQADVVDVAQLLEGRHFDVIVHCAAIAPLPECQIDSFRAISQNVAVCGSIVDYALISGSRNIIFISSGAVYEGVEEFPTLEKSCISTSLVYPATKYMAEQYFETMCRSHDINVTAIRLFNLYGPFQDYFRKQPPLIGYLLKCLLYEEEAMLFSSGEQRRDYIYIEDLLGLVLLSSKAMKESKVGKSYTVVNAGSGISTSVNEIIALLESISGKTIKVKRQPASQYWNKYSELFKREIVIDYGIIEREVNKYTQASVEKAKQKFCWEVKTELAEGLRSCFVHAKEALLNTKGEK